MDSLSRMAFDEQLKQLNRWAFDRPSQSEFTPPSRWVVTRGQVPTGADALLLLTVEEMAVNELRETFHHWVRTVALPIKGGVLGDAVAYAGPHGAAQPGVEHPGGTAKALEIWDDIDDEVRTWINNYRTQLTTTISAELKAAGAEATAFEKEAFERRIREVSALQRTASIEKISARSRPSMNENASSASMQRVSRTTATPTMASARIGATPSPDSATMPASVAKAIGALDRR